MLDGEPRSDSAAQAKTVDAEKHSNNGEADRCHDNTKSRRSRSVAMAGAQASRATRASGEMLGRPNEIDVLAKTIMVIATAQMRAPFNQ
jgi:hypothetical protein